MPTRRQVAIFIATVDGTYILERILGWITENWLSGISWLYSILTYRITLVTFLLGMGLSLILIWLVIHFIERRRPFRIISADYGTDHAFVDFTSKLRNAIVDGKIITRLSNDFVGRDPVRGTQKYATVTYRFKGKKIKKKYFEGDVIVLP